MCEQENQWDALINQQFRAREDRTTWTEAVQLAQRENLKAYEKDTARDRELIQKMQSIVDQETKLALQEGQTIRRGRTRRPLSIIKP